MTGVPPGWVAENLAAVRARIEAACRQAGRDPGSVRLLPVSKTHGPELIEAAYAAGVRLLAENRVQELAEKVERFADRPDLRWAVIGHLQSNKVRLAAELADEVQTIDATKTAYALDRRATELGRPLDVLLQVNSSDEAQKWGVAPEAVVPLAREVERCSALRVRGLMTIAVLSAERTRVTACFQRMREIQDQLRQTDGLDADYADLSMGMSGDFELAIEHGATTVRVGQAIFGER